MNRLKSILLVVFAATAMVGYPLLTAAPAEAQGGSAALSINPRKNYTIEPGKGVNDTLLIRNLDRERELYLSMRTIDFTFDEDGGTPKLMLDENAPQTTWSLKPFMETPEDVVVAPGASETIPININIPEDQGAGSFYSAIVYSSGTSEGGNVGLTASGVSLVFVTVPGEVDEKLTLEKLGAYDAEDREYRLFNAEMPRRIGYTLRNEGNVTESPVGSVTLRDIFGRERTINDINPSRSLALIGQTRTFDTCIMQSSEAVDFDGSRQEATICANPGLWPGFYRVLLHGFYGQNGNNTQELLGKGYFFYLPWWFVMIFLVVAAIIGYHIWRIVRFFRGKSGGRVKGSTSRGRR